MPPAKSEIESISKTLLASLGERNLPGEVIKKSPAERGLCNDCARFNWTYHLERYLDNIELDSTSIYEDSLVYETIRTHEPSYTERIVDDQVQNWYLIKNTPYSGSYHMNEHCSSAKMVLGFRHSSDLSQRKCSLCNLIFDAIKARNSGSRIRDQDTSDDLNHHDCVNFPISSIHIQLYNIGRYDPSKRVLTVDIYSQLNPTGRAFKFRFWFAKSGRGPAVRSMINPHQIDLNHFMYGLKSCKFKHGDRCRPQAHHKIPNFKLIDTWTDRVITSQEGWSYIALSYVWGNTQNFRLKSADFIRYHYPIGSSETFYAQLDRHKLPRTIRDAMFLVETLGERYFWVDSLCIVEDNDMEMKEMIHSMDRVYKAATLTIVAASGDDANAGLPGIYPGSRSLPTGSIESTRLVSVIDPVSLAANPWTNRGWTYQEYHFSTRCLVFTEQSVRYECPEGFWQESSPKMQAPDPPAPRAANINFDTADDPSFRCYAFHVPEYTRRNLTFEEDILNAFTAILQDISARFDTTFCWGLPTQSFFKGLLWCNAFCSDKTKSPLKRRTGHRKGHAQFPSWSWAGWVGPVQYSTSFKCHAHKLLSDLVWPWDSEYHVDCEEDVFRSGILTIDVHFTTLNHLHLCRPNDVKYCRLDDGTQWTSGTKQCFSLGRTAGEPAGDEHVLMIVEQGSNGIFIIERVFFEFWRHAGRYSSQKKSGFGWDDTCYQIAWAMKRNFFFFGASPSALLFLRSSVAYCSA